MGGRLIGGSRPQRPADKQPPGGRGHPSSRPSLPLRHLREHSKQVLGSRSRLQGSRSMRLHRTASAATLTRKRCAGPGRMTASPPMPLRAFSRGRWICVAREGCVCWGRRVAWRSRRRQVRRRGKHPELKGGRHGTLVRRGEDRSERCWELVRTSTGGLAPYEHQASHR